MSKRNNAPGSLQGIHPFGVINYYFKKSSKMDFQLKILYVIKFIIYLDVEEESTTVQNNWNEIQEGKKIIEEHICVLCDRKFTQFHSLRTHNKRVHEGLKEHKCDLCEKAFTHSHTLKVHKQKVHEGLSGRFTCSFCKQTFWRLYTLRLHLSKSHNIQDSQNYVENPLQNLLANNFEAFQAAHNNFPPTF